MEINKKSELYSELSEDELLRIGKECFPDQSILNYRLQQGGMFNTCYYVEMSSSIKFILRVGPINRHLLMEHEHGMMDAEVYVVNLCSKNGIPVSNILKVDCSKKIIDRDYMIVEYIPSVSLAELTEKLVDTNELFCETGRIARKLNSISGTRFGRVSLILQGEGYSSWRDAVLAEIESIKKSLKLSNLYSEDELDLLDKALLKDMSLFNDITVPYLVHADLWAGNILISDDEDNKQVAAIIDGDRALFGDPEFDLASGWMINDSFLKGYGGPPAGDSRSIQRREIYKIMYNLCDEYVLWAQYNRRDESKEIHKAILKKCSLLI